MTQYVLGTGVTGLSYNAMPNDACAYLFTNYYSDTVVNPKGLFDRHTVFFELGIPTAQVDTNVLLTPTSSVSRDYKRAMVKGSTLGALIAREGREAVEARVIERAQQDWAFARMLEQAPHATLQDFLGVKIPETLRLAITVENPSVYSLVIPLKELPLASYEAATD